MSKGGAGKVYFVLYLAVILELLIIIVERDEAEEHLVKKQQESMRIVESILTQLQSGAGTEGINTRPQDAIVLSEKLPEEQRKYFKKFRTYYIEVGVTDVASALNMDGMDDAQKKEKIETLKKLANVQELQYEVYFHPSKEVDVPPSPPASEFKKVQSSPQSGMRLANPPNATSTETWELQATRKLELSTKSMKDFKEPSYSESSVKTGDIAQFAPPDSARVNRIFGYSDEKTDRLRQSSNGKLTKRAFVCNFQPPSKPGWYKLRFSSQTNRIMGISAEQKFNSLKDDQKVNIGTVQLKVKDLRSVQRQLSDQLSGTGIPSADAFANGSLDLDRFNDQLETAKKKVIDGGGEKVAQNTSRIDLFGYIAKLLSPGRYTTFDQNKGSIEIDIFVQQPEIEQEDPIITWDDNGQLYSFDKAGKYVATFVANLYDKATPSIQFNGSTSGVSITKVGPTSTNGKAGRYKVEVNRDLSPGEYKMTASLSSAGKTVVEEMNLKIFSTGLATVKTEEGDDVKNEEEITGLVKSLSKGDAVEFTAVPTSGSTIPGSQFRTIIDGTTKKSPVIGLQVGANDGYNIPIDADRVSVRIVWQDPKDQSIQVQIFPSDGSNAVEAQPGPKRPRVVCGDASRITDAKTPIFFVNVEIKAPTYADITATIKGVKFEVKEQNIKGYKVVPVGEPKLTSGKWTQSYRLDGKLPIPRGTGGSIKIQAKAAAQLPSGETSPEASKSCKFNIVF
ncbi:MAG: hypothetical protein FJ212_02360 [Ignavibacteria bacterium]|nr:hypothetical protein [Ignavibacteria bacterium]